MSQESKKLYNNYDAYTKEGSEFDEKVHDALSPLIEEYYAQGFDAAHIENLIQGVVSQLCTFAKAKRALDARMKEKAERCPQK